ncbi:MAG: 50S ribosomal protein L3 [Conexivisphaerales archaeon]
MGHRKHSAPRRGSLAFFPRSRAETHVPRMRTWAQLEIEKPVLAGYFTFKAGMVHVITADDREKTINFGKPRFNAATVLAVPPMRIYGLRAYEYGDGAYNVLSDIYDYGDPLFAKAKKKPSTDEQFRSLLSVKDKVSEVFALVAVSPKDVGLSEKEPLRMEVAVTGGKVEAQLEFVKGLLGMTISLSGNIAPGTMVDLAAVSKGKGFEGPVTRMGIKRKQHKSRKTIRAVGVLSPWHPHGVMYTVARAGQMGYHQRIEYNHRVLIISSETASAITPEGGFPHFGLVRGDYVVVKGSVPGPYRRPVVVRLPLRTPYGKGKPPTVLFISSRPSGGISH